VVDAGVAALAVPCTTQRLGRQIHHQALGGEADHLAQEAGVGTLLQKLAKGDLVLGHRGDLQVSVASDSPTLPRDHRGGR
jgi:hypothetical protein